jgi:hypothetical protein
MIRRFKLMGLMFLFFLSQTTLATNVNGRFVVVSNDSSKLSLLLQINTNTGSDAMGGATIVIGFDTSSTKFKSNPIKNTDYVIHNFCGGNYSPATITRPMNNKIWINIDLPFNNSNNGTVVADSNNWTNIATIHFDIVNAQRPASFWWMTNSTFWGVYDDDNISLWNIGHFEDLADFIIPVELCSFTAALLNNNSVQLKWITATSLNNYGFEIERASSMTTPLQRWEKIGFVEGIGTCTSAHEFGYTDITEHNSPIIKYRLKVIDMDGSYTYSDVVEVETVPIKFELAQNYPNPFNPSTRISWQSPVSSHQTLKVYDVLGNEVVTLIDEFKPAGSYEVEFNTNSAAGGLASGVYIYRLQTTPSAGSGQAYTETKKMVLLR